MKKSFVFIFSIMVLLIVSGCATKGKVKPEEEQPAITSLNINGNSISIEVSRPFTYTIYRSKDDPCKVIAELYDVLPGIIIPNKRITSDKGGISGVLPSLLDNNKGLRLEIQLQAPLKEEAEFMNTLLVIKFLEEAATQVAAEISEEPQKVEVIPVEPSPQLLLREETKPTLYPAKTVQKINIHRKDGFVEVEILADGEMKPNIFTLDGKIVIDIPGAISKAQAPEAITPIKAIRIGRHPDNTRIVLDLMKSSSYEINAKGERLVISVVSSEKAESPRAETPVVKPESSLEIKAKVEEPVSEEIPQEKLKYKGKKISLDFQEADLTAILRLISDVSGYNVVIHPDVKGNITLKLLNVPWDQALELILKTNGLDVVVEGNIMRIAPYSVLAKEFEEKAKVVEAGIKAESLITQVYSVNFADPKDVEKFIKDAKALSPRGSISVDERTNSLIIKDVESAFSEIERLLKSVDKSIPQVIIDARIVEVNSHFIRDLGIQWGINWILSTSPDLRIGGPAGMPGGSGFTETNYMVNLPAAVSAGSGGAIGLGYMNARKTLSLDLQLSALEATGKGKVISNPRIVTLDNKEATIKQGKQIPVQTVSAEGTQTTTLNAVLELKVKPHITPDGSILLKLDTKKDEPDFTKLVGGIPTIDTKQATTDVLIKDGETLVIGGILKKTEQVSEGGVPLLRKIPIIGWLFKKKTTSEETNELMIFITPRILK